MILHNANRSLNILGFYFHDIALYTFLFPGKSVDCERGPQPLKFRSKAFLLLPLRSFYTQIYFSKSPSILLNQHGDCSVFLICLSLFFFTKKHELCNVKFRPMAWLHLFIFSVSGVVFFFHCTLNARLSKFPCNKRN